MKKTVRILIFIFFSLALIAKGQTTSKTNQTKTRIEGRILKAVNDLPEVKAFMLKAKKQKPLLMIGWEPDSKNKYYWIKVGLSGMNMFRTEYDFYVDPKTYTVYYLDMMVDDGDVSSNKLTLQEWRHWRTNPNFYKIHKYKNGKLVVL